MAQIEYDLITHNGNIYIMLNVVKFYEIIFNFFDQNVLVPSRHNIYTLYNKNFLLVLCTYYTKNIKIRKKKENEQPKENCYEIF